MDAALEAICKQLANGAKHFTVKDHYNAVERTTVWTPARSGLARSGVTRSGDVTGHLVIDLGHTESIALGRTAISTAELAEMVLKYWKAHPAIARAATRLQSAKQTD